ncbi:adenosylmethionine decarboxylase [Ranunculus cassubicifolius]
MAVSGFEGFEKRLEIHFSGNDPMKIGIGLRQLEFELLEEVLDAVQCTVVAAVGNSFFDAYVLSESSLFVYPTKIIIKTCGTTQLLKSIPLLISHAQDMGLGVSGCRYTRGSFIFPKAQPFPHSSFREEVMYLEENLPSNLCYRKASVMPSKKPKSSHSWHIYTACDEHHMLQENPEVFTIEVCMTELDQILARNFFQRPDAIKSGDMAGKEMTEITGIDNINPSALICDYGFDPCGYSMNGIDGAHYSTIHVTPEDGYSYASFECLGSNYDTDIVNVLKKVVQIFRPATMSVSTTGAIEGMSALVRDALKPFGLKCRSCTKDEFPSAGNVVFQTFTSRRSSRKVECC